MTQPHVTVNRDYWNGMAQDWVQGGERLWAAPEPIWGIWEWPESDLRLLPRDMTGMDAVELGCGTGYVASWMARRGATATGIDVSDAQLATARRLAKQHGADITLLQGNAETLPFDDASFDFAISEYGAAIWCDPQIWLREAYRVLRPGGRLVFLGNHPMTLLCSGLDGAPCDFRLHRPYKNLRSADWTNVEIDPGGIEFNLGLADWLALFRDIGFQVHDYKEIYAPDHASGVNFSIPADWAKAYPSEQIWVLNRPA